MPEVLHLSDLDLNKQYTYADYLLWRFTERVELLRGYIREMSPAPNRRHQAVLTNLLKQFFDATENKSCNLFIAPFDVRLPIPSAKKNTTVVQPDICFVCDNSKLDDFGCNGAPDLIVEILSPSNIKYDAETKFNLYEEAGVKEYWMVSIESKTVLVYTLKDGKYIGLRPFTQDQHVESVLFPDFNISVNDIFDRLD
jgi:Uma2 family endonuclease